MGSPRMLSALPIGHLSLEPASACKAHEACAADHDVIEDGDAEDLPCILQSAGDLAIFRTRLRVPARMVVRDDQRRRRLAQRRTEHLARMHEALVQAPAA